MLFYIHQHFLHYGRIKIVDGVGWQLCPIADIRCRYSEQFKLCLIV